MAGTILNGKVVTLDNLMELERHNTKIFPDSTELNCVLAAHADADTWSAWAEIEDDTPETPITLSSKFAACKGHITGMVTESANQDTTAYQIEVAFGASKVGISSWRLMSGTSKVSSTGQSSAQGDHIPLGETIYYRVKCETAGAKTLNVHFRYFCHT